MACCFLGTEPAADQTNTRPGPRFIHQRRLPHVVLPGAAVGVMAGLACGNVKKHREFGSLKAQRTPDLFSKVGSER